MDIYSNRFLSFESQDGSWSFRDFQDFVQIGNGGFSKVFKAYNTWHQKQYALKQFDLKQLSQNSLINIQKEMEIHSKLNNKQIIQYYTSFKDGRFVYIVLELFDGPNLFNFIRNWNLSLDEIRLIFHQCVTALSYLHSRGVVMRDFKPENILICPKNLSLKLCDFGWASYINDKDWLCRMAGTYVYMSPEQLQHQLQGFETDLWSLGVFLYELFHKKEPYPGEEPKQVLIKILNNSLIFDHQSCPPEAVRIIQTLLNKDKFRRGSLQSILNQQFCHISFSKQFSYEENKPSYELEKTQDSIANGKNIDKLKNSYFQNYHFDLRRNQSELKINKGKMNESQGKQFEKLQINFDKVDYKTHKLYQNNDSQKQFAEFKHRDSHSYNQSQVNTMGFCQKQVSQDKGVIYSKILNQGAKHNWDNSNSDSISRSNKFQNVYQFKNFGTFLQKNCNKNQVYLNIENKWEVKTRDINLNEYSLSNNTLNPLKLNISQSLEQNKQRKSFLNQVKQQQNQVLIRNKENNLGKENHLKQIQSKVNIYNKQSIKQKIIQVKRPEKKLENKIVKERLDTQIYNSKQKISNVKSKIINPIMKSFKEYIKPNLQQSLWNNGSRNNKQTRTFVFTNNKDPYTLIAKNKS